MEIKIEKNSLGFLHVMLSVGQSGLFKPISVLLFPRYLDQDKLIGIYALDMFLNMLMEKKHPKYAILNAASWRHPLTNNLSNQLLEALSAIFSEILDHFIHRDDCASSLFMNAKIFEYFVLFRRDDFWIRMLSEARDIGLNHPYPYRQRFSLLRTVTKLGLVMHPMVDDPEKECHLITLPDPIRFLIATFLPSVDALMFLILLGGQNRQEASASKRKTYDVLKQRVWVKQKMISWCSELLKWYPSRMLPVLLSADMRFRPNKIKEPEVRNEMNQAMIDIMGFPDESGLVKSEASQDFGTRDFMIALLMRMHPQHSTDYHKKCFELKNLYKKISDTPLEPPIDCDMPTIRQWILKVLKLFSEPKSIKLNATFFLWGSLFLHVQSVTLNQFIKSILVNWPAGRLSVECLLDYRFIKTLDESLQADLRTAICRGRSENYLPSSRKDDIILSRALVENKKDALRLEADALLLESMQRFLDREEAKRPS